MKKLLSLAIATVMAMSTMCNVAFAKTITPTISVSATEFSDSDNTTYSKVLGEDGKGYWLTYKISDIGTLTQIEDSLGLGDVGGRKLSTSQFTLTFTDKDKVSRANNMGGTIAAKSDMVANWNGDSYVTVWSSPSAIKSYPTTTGSITEIADVIKVMVVVNSDVMVTPKVVGQLTSYDQENSGAAIVNSEEPFTYTGTAIELKGKSSKKPVTGITVSANDMTVGDADQLPTVVVAPTDATEQGFTLASSNTDVATIVSGKIHAVGAGKTTITATAIDGSGVSGSCEITVSKAAPQIVIDANTGLANNNSAKAWGLTINNFDSEKTYTARFTHEGGTSKDKVIPFTGISGELSVKRVIIIESLTAKDADKISLNVSCN